MTLFLTSCAPIQRQQARARAWWAEVTGTASGAYVTVKGTAEDALKSGRVVLDSGTEVVRQAGETLQEFQDRVEKVKTGVEKIAEGKKLIQEGVGSGG